MATITGLTPSQFDSGVSLVIAGSGFGATEGSVYIGGDEQTVTSWSDTSITVTTARGSQSMGSCLVAVEVVASDTITDGGTFTLSGTFPAKATAAPLYYEDFESYAVDTVVTSCGLSAGGVQGVPVVSTARPYLGAKHLRADYGTGDPDKFPKVYLGSLNEQEIYCSAHMYYSLHTSGSAVNPIFKLWRIGGSPVYTANPHSFQTIRPAHASGVLTASDKGVSNTSGIMYFNDETGSADRDQWNRMEHWFKMSTIDDDDGVCAFYSNFALDSTDSSNSTISGHPTGTATAAPTYSTGDDSAIAEVMTPYDGMDSYGSDNGYYVDVDCLYIDNTPIRLELGDNATYASCTERIPVPAASWSTSTIVSAALNLSRWSPDDVLYAFVIGADNTVAAGPFTLTVV